MLYGVIRGQFTQLLGIQLTGRPADRGERGTIHGLSKLSPDFHVEADECGALNEWLAVAPQAAPLCGTVAAMVASNDLADRPPRALADGAESDSRVRQARDALV